MGFTLWQSVTVCYWKRPIEIDDLPTSSTRTRRGGSCLRDTYIYIYKTFLIYRTCMRRAPAKPVRACILRKWCPVSHVTFEAPLRSSRFTLHTPHTPHFKLPTAHSTLHTLHTTHFTLHSPHLRLHVSHSTLHISQSTLHTSHCTLLAHFTVHTSHFTLHTSLHSLSTSHLITAPSLHTLITSHTVIQACTESLPSTTSTTATTTTTTTTSTTTTTEKLACTLCASQARACVLSAKLLQCCCPRTWPARAPGTMLTLSWHFTLHFSVPYYSTLHTCTAPCNSAHLSPSRLIACLPICQRSSCWLVLHVQEPDQCWCRPGYKRLHKLLSSHYFVHCNSCTKHVPVLLCTTQLAQNTSHLLLHTTKLASKHFWVLLCHLQSLHNVLPSTTLYYLH